jgi:hypothetical protein
VVALLAVCLSVRIERPAALSADRPCLHAAISTQRRSEVIKIPTIFVRDMSKQPTLVLNAWVAGTEWVRDGEGIATRKYDGTSCLVRNRKLYKRRELRQNDAVPPDFESLGFDENTGKTVGWVPIGDGPEDRWHREAWGDVHNFVDGTYELMGPKIQGNKDGFIEHMLIPHGCNRIAEVPRTFEGLKGWLAANVVEGVVWHHSDGRMAKIKRRDFGLKW